MAKKVLFVFAGTGVSAQMIRDFTEGSTPERGETFQDDVIRIYFNGCQDEHIGGGGTKIKRYLDPDLDVAANKTRRAFSRVDDVVTLNLRDLKREFGNSIIIEPQEGLDEVEEINDITLNGFSRGAVTTFAAARALDNLETPISILAEDPVPGNDRAHTYNHESVYAKNFDLSACKNIVRGEVILGTYSKHNNSWENKWYRQMAPKFDETTTSHIFMVPKKMHIEFNRRATTYSSAFLYNRGLTTVNLRWNEQDDRAYVIPKGEQQKFHFGVVGRAEYLPSYKMSVLERLGNKYPLEDLPLNEDSKFKYGQALLAVHNASTDEVTFTTLSEAVLETTERGKGLREFIVEFDSIVQYSKEQSPLKSGHIRQMAALENNIYKIIADFYVLENPTLKQQETFERAVQARINLSRTELPTKVYNKLRELTSILLSENTLTHPHLVKFINENETFAANLLTANQRALDGVVTNADELSQKLFHSSVKQRSVIFEQVKKSLPGLINSAADLADVAPFFTPKQLKQLVEIVNQRILTMNDLLLLMKTLPTYEHRQMIYQALKENVVNMNPTLDDLVKLMEYLSDKECQKLCEIVSIPKLSFLDLETSNELMKQRLTNTKITLLNIGLDAIPSSSVTDEVAEPSTFKL